MSTTASPTPAEVTHDRLLPQNVEAEQAVLGAILIDNEAIAELAIRLKSGDFYRPAHAWIYEAMVQLYDHRQPIDYVTVVDQLKKIKAQLQEARSSKESREWVDIGIEYLAELAERVPTSANAMWYAAQVRTRAILRELIGASIDINRDCFDFAGDLSEFLDTVEQKIFGITQRDIGKEVVTVRSVLQEVFTKLDEYQDRAGRLTGLPSGFFELDELTGGFQDGEMIIVAARPSMGKTTVALSIARYVGLQENIPIAFFSCEMGRAQIVQNMLCAEAKINSKRLRSGYLDEYEYDRLVQAANRLADAPVYIDDTPGIGLREVRAKCRRLKEQKGIKAMFLDYLQLMGRPAGLGASASREQEIGTISRGLKALARELNIPVVILAQLNRDVEKRTGSHRPRMSDLRESGSIEQDADVIALLHREHYYTRNEEDLDKAELILAKQRNGPTGTARLRFRPEYMRFDNPDDEATGDLPGLPHAGGGGMAVDAPPAYPGGGTGGAMGGMGGRAPEPAGGGALPDYGLDDAPPAPAAPPPALNPGEFVADPDAGPGDDQGDDDYGDAPFDFDGPPIL